MDNEFTQTAIEGPKQFFKDGVAFMKRCTKPDRKGTFPPLLASSHGLDSPQSSLYTTPDGQGIVEHSNMQDGQEDATSPIDR